MTEVVPENASKLPIDKETISTQDSHIINGNDSNKDSNQKAKKGPVSHQDPPDTQSSTNSFQAPRILPRRYWRRERLDI